MIRGGRTIVTSAPAFSNDAKKLLLCAGNTISIFSTATGLEVAALEAHSALVTVVIVVPSWSPATMNLNYCWTASLDGTIRYWDFSTPTLLKTVEIHLPVYSMVIPSLMSEQQQLENIKTSADLFAYVSVRDTSMQKGFGSDPGVKRKGKQPPPLYGQVRRCNLTKSLVKRGEILKGTEEPKQITVSPSGDFFGICDKGKLHIWKVPSANSKNWVAKMITLHHTKSMSVFAFHPTQRIVVVGDETGRILIFRGFGNKTYSADNRLTNGNLKKEKEDKPGVRDDDDAGSCSTYHWHPTEVRTLVFSSDGASFYSGGKEGVLVVWQLETGKKRFLPRIGSPLLYFTFSPDPSLSSISCADNQVHMLKMPSMEIFKSISGIKPAPLSAVCDSSLKQIAFDHSSGLVALCTDNYCVQLYSLFDDRGISEVQVCERNHQPIDDVTVVVSTVALSPDGSIMATAEVKLPEDGIGGLVSLKFWVSESQNKAFNLSTIVYEPHRDSGISAIAFHPDSRMAVSASSGGDFKVWVKIQQKDGLKDSSWICHAVGSYKKRPMTAAAFSSDGSVLAVAAKTAITLWNADKNILLSVIGETTTPIMNLSFIGNSEYLVAASEGPRPQLSVWNMQNLSLSWSYMLQVEAVASTLDSSSFAVLAILPSECFKSNKPTFLGRDGVILLFNGTTPIPVATWSVSKAKGGALAFIQPNPSENGSDEKQSQLMLAYMNSNHEYVLFDPCSNDEPLELNVTRHKGLGLHEETERFGYTSLYGDLPEFDTNRSPTDWIPSGSSARPWETIFSGSSHNLPPLTKLCTSFLESLLEKRPIVVE